MHIYYSHQKLKHKFSFAFLRVSFEGQKVLDCLCEHSFTERIHVIPVLPRRFWYNGGCGYEEHIC